MPHVPRKSLGQHFLHQARVIEEIVRYIDPRSDDILVEIGPGHGALTFALLPLAEKVHAIELDQALAEKLAAQNHRNLTVHHADALTVDYCAFEPRRKIRIIGNLPYNISTPLLFKFLSHKRCVVDICVMLQREVGERILAPPGGKQYGRLSVMLQQSCQLQRVTRVAPGAFVPPPKVESVVLHMRPYADPPCPVADKEAFDRAVRLAFSSRRKTVRNALRSVLTSEQLVQANIDPGARPEQLSVEDFTRIAEILARRD